MVREIAKIFGFAVGSTKETQKHVLEMPPSDSIPQEEESGSVVQGQQGMAFFKAGKQL